MQTSHADSSCDLCSVLFRSRQDIYEGDSSNRLSRDKNRDGEKYSDMLNHLFIIFSTNRYQYVLVLIILIMYKSIIDHISTDQIAIL